MPWDVETARTVLKEPTDPPSDAALQRVIDYTRESIETLLGRKLLRDQEEQTYYDSGLGSLQARRYPVETLDAVDGEVPLLDGEITVRHLTGIFEGLPLAWKDKITLLYSGGYDDSDTPGADSFPLPADLDRAFWEAFVTAWNASDQETGLPPSSGGGGVIVGSGDVKSLTVFDAFKVDYDVGVSSSGSDTGADDEANWGWLAPWATVLSMYRSGPEGVGLGIA